MIETARVRLRRVKEEDYEPLWAIWSDPRVQEGLITRPQTREDFADIFAELRHTETLWTIEDTPSGRVIGRCGLFSPNETRLPELAYLLHPDFWGAGIATEAASAALDHAIDARGWTHIVAIVLPTNHASIAILTKLGFVYQHDLEVRGRLAQHHARDVTASP